MALSPPEILKSELENYCKIRGLKYGCLVFKIVDGRVRKTEITEYFLEDETKSQSSGEK